MILSACMAVLLATPQYAERIDVIAVEVPIAVRDRDGNIPQDLTKDDFEVLVYLQESMSSTSGLRSGLRGLLDEVDRLTAMGDVEIVSDFPAPHVELLSDEARVARRRLHARASMTSATFRVAIAVTPNRKPPFHDIQKFERVDLASITKWEVSFLIRNRGGAAVAVVIEELSTGTWGGARCE